MNWMNKLRYNGFWLLDRLKGGPLKKDLNDISNSFQMSSFSVLQNQKAPILKKLLDTVVNASEFYHKYKSYKSLDDFPIINKLTIKENFDTINILPNTSKDIVKVSSSGSTGIPFSIYWTKKKAIRNKADVIFYANSAGYTIGDQLLFVRLWSKKYRKHFFIKKALNLVQVDIESLTDKNIATFIANIKSEKHPKGFIGYPSGFEKICNYLDKIKSPPLDCNIQSIIATSETLYDNVREKMAYYFKAPVVSRYSNEENGIISQQMIGDKYYTINWSSFYVEIFDINEDKPLNHGELGRIIVTDLYNLATPMIRYDTGDLGRFCNFENDKIPKLEDVVGRSKDILYNTNGEIVSPFIIHTHLYNYPELNQFQIIQKDKYDYIFKINCTSKFKKEDEFTSLFKSYLGSDANILIEYTNEIPLLSSGKRRIIVNLYKP
tara:strand:- start:3398 stop:4702 length:1305 start_codon:yes stop_codon:yes gene_type:complete